VSAAAPSTSQRKPRAQFVYIDGPRYYPGVDRSGPPATIGTDESCDFAQQPWPDYPTLWDIHGQYVREWVVPQKCDLSRTVAALFRTYRVWEPQRDARTFTRADGRDFVAMRRSDGVCDGVCDGTVRRDLTIAMAAFGHAKREERIPEVPKFAMPKGGEPRMRFLTPQEHGQLMRVVKPHRRMMFWLLAFETGVRSKAIEELRWSQVDLVNRVIDFRTPGKDHKNKRRPLAPINDRLYPRLVAAKQRHDEKCPLDPFVIGKGCTTYAGCKADLRAIGICERGVARHVARHTFCSWRVQAGWSYGIVGKLVGDTAAMIEKVYAHLSPEHLREASNFDVNALKVAA
jgi:integrase